MPTTSTFVEVKTKLLELLTAEFAAQPEVSVAYSWYESDDSPQMVFLSRMPVFDADRDRTTGDVEPGPIKAGRQSVTETFTVPVTVASFRPDLTPADAQTADAQALALADRVKDVVQDDPSLGLTSILWARYAGWEREQFPAREGGWAVVLVLLIEVSARLN